MTRRRLTITLLLLISLVLPTALQAATVTLAVAANFTATMKVLAERFEAQTGHTARISYGSTGKLYAQILNNAPFDLYLAADQQRPLLLEQKGLATQRFTYAIGRLVLWSKQEGLVLDASSLGRDQFNRVAIANPKTAPYGAAALEVLRRLGIEEHLTPQLVYGESIAQTYQFVATGNADIGFVASAQVTVDNNGSLWVIPAELYPPIHQDAVLLQHGRGNPAAIAFIEFLNSDEARNIIRNHGYATD